MSALAGVSPEAVDVLRLQGWMQARGLDHGPIEQARMLSGGTQNLLVHLRHEDGFCCVLRRPQLPARAEVGAALLREARVLGALAATAVPHARLLAACSDDGVLGAPFYLMQAIDGFNPSGTPLPGRHAKDPAWRRRMGLALVDALLALGEVDPAAVGLADLGRPQGFLQRQVGRWQRQLEGCRGLDGWEGPEGLTGVAEVGRWLQQHCPAAGATGLMHGDFHLSNVMFRRDSPELAAVVDWELTTIGDPLLDLGWLLATWPDAAGQGAGTIHVQPWSGFPTPAELVEHYGRHSPRPLDHLDWYVVLARYKLGILLECSHARSCAGLGDPCVGKRHHASAQRLLRQALDLVES